MSEHLQAQRVREGILRNRALLEKRSICGYLLFLLTRARPIRWARLVFERLHGVRAVAFCIRLLSVLVSVLEIGSLLLLATALLCAVLPVLLMLWLSVVLAAWLRAEKSNCLLSKISEGRRVYIFFAKKKSSPFFLQTLHTMSERGTVILVSPYWLSAASPLGGARTPYATVRKEAESIYLVRRVYFFILRKKVLAKRETVCVY